MSDKYYNTRTPLQPLCEIVFMYEAAWVFIYTLSSEKGKPVMKKYDRDFGSCQIVRELDHVLEKWWKIVIEN